MKLSDLLFQIYFLPVVLGFLIPEKATAIINNKSDTTVKIGLLIPDRSSLAAKQGAEMAIQMANGNGGLNKVLFKLVELPMEGLWGTGSKQTVNLIFDENVAAILGSADGRNAHLIEQVSAKTRVVFMSAWSGDPTLSQAYVPWYFSCVPNDVQQADALFEEIYFNRKENKIALVSDNEYDSKLALNNFLKKTRLAGKPDPLEFFCENSDEDLNRMIDMIVRDDVSGIVLFGQPANSLRLMKQLKLRNIDLSVFGSLSVMGEHEFNNAEMKFYENATLINSGQWFNSEGRNFRQEFSKRYGYFPGPVAAYAFDGMMLIINAIRNGGTDREQIQNYLRLVTYNGVTGVIRFDERGNRTGKACLMKIKNGIPAATGR